MAQKMQRNVKNRKFKQKIYEKIQPLFYILQIYF